MVNNMNYATRFVNVMNNIEGSNYVLEEVFKDFENTIQNSVLYPTIDDFYMISFIDESNVIRCADYFYVTKNIDESINCMMELYEEYPELKENVQQQLINSGIYKENDFIVW